MIEKEFEDLNMNNLLDYLGFLSNITKNDKISIQKKKIYLKQFLKLNLTKKIKRKIFMKVVKKWILIHLIIRMS